MDETVDAVEVAHNIERFLAHESCGQCTPCREGSNWSERILERLLEGKGEARTSRTSSRVGENITGKVICALGDTVGMVTRAYITKFPEDFKKRVPKWVKRSSIKLNGGEREAEEGQLVIDAAKDAGIEIPHYCYHPALGNPGNCRMCIVEVAGAPKPHGLLPHRRARGPRRQDRLPTWSSARRRPRWSSTSSTIRSTAPSATRAASAVFRTTT